MLEHQPKVKIVKVFQRKNYRNKRESNKEIRNKSEVKINTYNKILEKYTHSLIKDRIYLLVFTFLLIFVMFFSKFIQGSFNQGNETFGETAGMQCTCCSLFSVVFSLVKSPGYWEGKDLDFIIDNGDRIYKSLNVSNYLMISELPHQISIFQSSTFRVDYKTNKYGVLNHLSTAGSILNRHSSSDSNGLLLILKGLCISIVWTKRDYYLFDSHSKNEKGESSPDGYSILLKFTSMNSLELHIIKNYITQNDGYIQFEVQYIQVCKTSSDNISMLYHEFKERNRMATDAQKEKTRKRMCTDTQKEKTRKRVATETQKEKARKRLATDAQKEKTRKRLADTYAQKKKSCKNKATVKGKKKTTRIQISNSKSIYNSRISAFKAAVKEGPYYICVVCNRCLYRKTVKHFDENKYNFEIPNMLSMIQSFDSFYYICLTCDRYLLKRDIPCQAVWNKLHLDDIPEEIKILNRLEKILISKRLLFKKISIIGKGNQQHIKGAVCNVPVRADAVLNCLPRSADNDGILFVKVKRKLIFRGHVYFERVQPENVERALCFLKNSNPFYSNILIQMDNVNRELLSLSDPDSMVDQNEFSITLDDNENDEENPLDNECVNCDEMCVIPVLYNEHQGILDIAPGENKTPESFFNDDFCEEQAFPYLFPKGKFGYKVERAVPLSPVKYFNQRLLNYSQRFSSNADYIFFAHYVMQQHNLFNQINIATCKVSGSLNAGQLQKNLKETVRSFVCEDNGYMFMKSVKGTPAYWKHFLYDVLAMVKQLGLPSFFLSLSCADLRWDELLLIIARLNNIDLEESDIDHLRKCEILNQNPVLVARHFQFRVETFFKEILLHKNGPLGIVEHYVIKVEFQLRGSPHIHAFLWVKNPPLLTKESKDEYVSYINSIIRTDLPDENTEPELFKLVKNYQTHSHSRSCKKYKNISCRFHYGRFFTDRTICAVPLGDNISDVEKSVLLSERAEILQKVKQYIDENLNPRKPNYIENITIPQVLDSLDISEDEYYSVLSIAPGEDFEIYLRRPTNSCFVNNYFAMGLKAWEANIDIQPVFNYYKAVSYMCSYFSKCETESSVAMKMAYEESENLSFKDKMKKLAIVFLSHRQCSVQEAVYQLMPELSLRKTYPAVVFANTNLPEKRFRICKSPEELSELPEDSIDVFKKNNLDRYLDRPNATFKGGKYRVLDNFCYAKFLAYYVLEKNPKREEENDCQPTVLDDDDKEQVCVYPKSIPMMTSKERMRCRTIKKVIRFHTPNAVTNAEAYAHHLLMLYFPFRKESELISNTNNTYLSKLNEPEVISIVNENKQQFEPWGDLVESSLRNYVYTSRTDDFAQQENDDLMETLNEEETENDPEGEVVDFQLQTESSSSGTPAMTSLSLLSNDEINVLIASLNCKQREVFNIVNSWARKIVARKSSEHPFEVDPLQIFITGGAGTGKSHLIRTIFASVSKTLSYCSEHLTKPKVLLLAPTGVAAVNISGNTIHSSLAIPIDCKGLRVSKAQDKKRCSMLFELEDVKAIIIDEISMVSNKLLLYIHQRLLNIYGVNVTAEKPFAGITTIVVGDLYQLPPVKQSPVFANYNDEYFNMFHPWRLFKMCELTEVMRQRGDAVFIDLLNNVRVGELSEKDEEILKGRFIDKESELYPNDALHIFCENEPARLHNSFMIQRINSQSILLEATDQVPKEVPNHIYDKILEKGQSQTGGLVYKLCIKIGARVMLTSNINISDKLINGQIGSVVFIKRKLTEVEAIYIKFDDLNAGRNRKLSDQLAQQYDAVPIYRMTANIKVREHLETSPIIKRTQFPLALSWACTVHKVQGLSLDKVVISFDLLKQKCWNNGQMYVALSRVTSLEGLFLIGEFTRKAITVDKRARNEYQYLREHQNLVTNSRVCSSSQLFSIMLCNVRSLEKHRDDIKSDTRFLENNLILCTETQLSDNQSCNIDLEGFSVIYNNSNHKYSSIAAYSRANVTTFQELRIDGVSIIKTSVDKLDLKILLLYRKSDWPKPDFYELIHYLTIANEIDFIMGDFNVKPNEQLNSILSEYRQLVTMPTHLGGSILDHVYVKNSLMSIYDVFVSVQSVFFTDHEAVLVRIRNKVD